MSNSILENANEVAFLVYSLLLSQDHLIAAGAVEGSTVYVNTGAQTYRVTVENASRNQRFGPRAMPTREGHVITHTLTERGEVRSTCTCGDSWTHPKGRLFSVRMAVDDAHTTYGQTLKSTVL